MSNLTYFVLLLLHTIQFFLSQPIFRVLYHNNALDPSDFFYNMRNISIHFKSVLVILNVLFYSFIFCYFLNQRVYIFSIYNHVRTYSVFLCIHFIFPVVILYQARTLILTLKNNTTICKVNGYIYIYK